MSKLIIQSRQALPYALKQGDTFLLPNNDGLFMVTEVDTEWVHYVIILVGDRQCGRHGHMSIEYSHQCEYVTIDEIRVGAFGRVDGL